MTLKMATPSLMMSQSIPKINSSDQHNNSAFKPSGFGLSCFTMIFGTISNLTALGILVKSRVRFRRQSKTPFLMLTIALLIADLGGHLIPGASAVYLHIGQLYKMQGLQSDSNFCQIFGATMVFFGLCPLLFGCAMAVERCVAITQPFFHASMITVTHTQRAVLLLSSLALVMSLLPFVFETKYTIQQPNTWCFLKIHTLRTEDNDTNLALAFSVLGLSVLIFSQLCNIVSGLVLLQGRMKSSSVHKMPPVHYTRRASTITSSSSFCTLDVEMMVQLAVITVISCVCWSPFLVSTLVLWVRTFTSIDKEEA